MTQETFPKFYPVIHACGGAETRNEFGRVFSAVCDNLAIAQEAGADGVFFINQGINVVPLMDVIHTARDFVGSLRVGLNILGSPYTACELARKYALGMVWCDDVGGMPVGGLRAFEGEFFGGVGFKYQRALAAEEVAPVLARIAGSVDYITTSGVATGQPPSRGKLTLYRDSLVGQQRLAVASGMNADNLEELVLDPTRDDGLLVHAVLVASSIESSFGHLDLAKTHAMGAVFRRLRAAHAEALSRSPQKDPTT